VRAIRQTPCPLSARHPEKIIAHLAGVFTSFTPFCLHFIIAAFLAMVMRGNVLARRTFLATLTYIPSPIPRWQRHYCFTRFDHFF
jgi:uncharacterized protein (DUF2062 family)